ncbi:hypothetical protein KY5_7922c [Streptomyces formicae]|uniref:Uncharacterized protein n=1 Tax=Streptomyces formicae TaxID=1616117 RepID=A0A291QM67_9ACTN|nr:hypothetical protein KY5_7922c [Streptomyces formicae]
MSGLSAVLYHQQEEALAGYGKANRPVKRQARVLLPYTAGGRSGDAGESLLAAVDFGVGRDGRLAQAPGELSLPILQRPQSSDDVERISELDARSTQLARDVVAKETAVQRLVQEAAALPDLERERDAARGELEQDQRAWKYHLRFRRKRDGNDQYMAIEGDRTDAEAPLIRTADKATATTLCGVDELETMVWDKPLLAIRNLRSGLTVHLSRGSRDDNVPFVQRPHDPNARAAQFSTAKRYADEYGRACGTICGPRHGVRTSG